jgi:formate dehydrogenase iron-sulfur subunit
MTALRLFVPRDAAARAVGADRVAAAIRDEANRLGRTVEIVRTGSRGLFWLEPLVEVATPAGRLAFGPVAPGDVAGLFAGYSPFAASHPLCLGNPEEIPFLKRQTRITFARCGIIDPLSLDDYRAHGGLSGLERARSLGAAGILAEVTRSGLRGRGGAGFPTGIKWKTVADTPADRKYIVCNADEGDSGTYADRMILEGDPFMLIEGMIIAGLAVGAGKGYVYIRSEYPDAVRAFARALAVAEAAGLLGTGSGFEIELRVGAGAYVCGEETSLLESLEGKRGQVRAKPPLPAHKGLFGRPTVINNLISLATVPAILSEGADAYAALGMGRSRGTMPIQLAGNVRQGGLFEAAFGLTLGEIVDEIGGGTASGRPVRAVQVGGPLGAYFPRALFDTAFDYEAFAALDGLIGHGGVVVFDDTVDMARQARFALEFCAIESCGKCTPCRIGSTRGVETLDKIMRGERVTANLALITDLCQTLKFGSLCALGGFTPYPVMSAIKHFPEDFDRDRSVTSSPPHSNGEVSASYADGGVSGARSMTPPPLMTGAPPPMTGEAAVLGRREF